MLLSKTTENAIKILFYLMDSSEKGYIRIRNMAEDLGLPYFQTAKIAQFLIKNNILSSYTGPNGGVQIKKDPCTFRLIDVVILLEGTNFLDKCILGLSECGSDNPCAVHHLWKDVKIPIRELFEEKTLCEIKEMSLLKGIQ